MPLTLYVGRPGTGKTIKLVSKMLEARDDLGRDLYTNFYLGERCHGFIVPTCPVPDASQRAWRAWTHWDDGAPLPGGKVACLGEGHALHEPVAGHGVAAKNELRAEWIRTIAGARRLREGRIFVRDESVTVLSSWEQVIAIRVARDELGAAHRLRLEKVGRDWSEDEEDVTEKWVAVPTCNVWSCTGCSKGVTIGLDELNLWAPSRLWQELGVDVLNRWAYIRKDGLDIYASAQHEGRVDVVARQVTNDIWSCNVMGGVVRMFGKDRHLQLFTRQRWEPTMLTDKNRTGATEAAQVGVLGGAFSYDFGLFDATAAESYDTYEHVQASPHLAKQKGKRGQLTAEAEQRIRAHLDGMHEKRVARTCPVCIVAAKPDASAVNVA